MQPTPLCPAPARWWGTQASGLLLHRQLWLGMYSVVLFLFLFSSQLCCPLRFKNSPQTCLWESSYCVETSPPSQFPPLGGQVSIPNSMSLFLSFMFCPTSFWREWAAFLGAWSPPLVFRSCFVEVDQHSNDFLMNLLGRKWCSILFLHHLRTAPLPHYFKF